MTVLNNIILLYHKMQDTVLHILGWEAKKVKLPTLTSSNYSINFLTTCKKHRQYNVIISVYRHQSIFQSKIAHSKNNAKKVHTSCHFDMMSLLFFLSLLSNFHPDITL